MGGAQNLLGGATNDPPYNIKDRGNTWPQRFARGPKVQPGGAEPAEPGPPLATGLIELQLKTEISEGI